jgi:hypothetical protein
MRETKLEEISNYFKERFPNDEHTDKYDCEKFSYLFIIITKDHILISSFSKEFIDDHEPQEIISTLENINICKLLIENPKSNITIGNKGTHIVPRD